MADEPFANPIAPLSEQSGHSAAQSTPAARHPLTNEDFRKLIATPRVGSSASVSRLRAASARSKRPHHSRSQKPVLSHDSSSRKSKSGTERHEDEAEEGKERKTGKQKEPDVLSELAQRYRDRAKERRDGANPDYVSNEEMMMTGNGAHVAPDQQSRSDFAERRKQLIEESKFLGGDMEHTHLVKGLDYALLHKVKAELQQMDEEEDEDGDEDDFVAEGKKEIDPSKNRPQAQKSDGTGGGDEFDVKSRLALSIVSLLNQKLQDRSELFVPSRMAYVVDLESEAPDDIPVTVIRSKSECPAHGAILSHSTSDIVINKLASIIHTHRTGRLKDTTARKEGTKEQEERKSGSRKQTWSTSETETTKSASRISIYDDLVDEYVPPRTKKKSTARN